MAYTILIGDDNSLYGSNKEKIMQREKLFNKLWFLVEPYYKGYDMSQCTVTMRYLLPISREFKTETLELSEERYEEYLKYVLPIDTCLTKEFGDIELNLTFILLDVDDNGNIVQRVRKTDNYILKIAQIPNWDSIIPDSALSELDQRIIKLDAQLKALNNAADVLSSNMVDNLKYDYTDDTIQLMAGQNGVGDKLHVQDMLHDGVPVVDFNSSSGGENTDDSDIDDSDIVEF